MHKDTGEIREHYKLTEEEKVSGHWVGVPDSEIEKVKGMNREGRREWARIHGKPVPSSTHKPFRRVQEPVVTA